MSVKNRRSQLHDLGKRGAAIEASVAINALVTMVALFQAAHRELREGQSA